MRNKIECLVRPDQLDRMELFDNRRKRLSITEVQAETGCDIVFPGPYFDENFQPVVHTKINGLELSHPAYTNYGVILTNGHPHLGKVPQDDALTYWTNDVLIINGMKRAEGNMHLHTDAYQRRGRAVIMELPDGRLLFRCTRDGGADARTVLGEQEIANKRGAVWAVGNDGGHSACCITPGGNLIYNDYGSDAPRKMPVYILGYLKKSARRPTEGGQAVKPSGKTVCLDAGHYTGCPNGNRALNYKEDEFTLDMSKRLGKLLERCGIRVIQTRKGDKYVGLTERSTMANKVGGLDLFVSLHSNANAKTYCNGFGIYTYGSGSNKRRNVAANAILRLAKADGVTIWGRGLFYNKRLSVLRKTHAPAILIEHGFHTNTAECKLLKSNAYRDKLAEIDARGICEALGVEWVPEIEPGEPDNMPNLDTEVSPVHREAVAWCKEHGITDGSRPRDETTREEACTMQYRLYQKILDDLR